MPSIGKSTETENKLVVTDGCSSDGCNHHMVLWNMLKKPINLMFYMSKLYWIRITLQQNYYWKIPIWKFLVLNTIDYYCYHWLFRLSKYWFLVWHWLLFYLLRWSHVPDWPRTYSVVQTSVELSILVELSEC